VKIIKSASIIAKITTFVVLFDTVYTIIMKIFTQATAAKKPKTKESQKIAYMYAAILILFVLTQLFTFDKFLILLESFWIPGGKFVAYMLGSLLVISEVLALPFLLGLKLSSLMRIICMGLGWFVSIVWLGLSLWLVLTVNAVSNIGFFGTIVNLVPGWWAVFISVALGLLAAWASWGLWPIANKKHHIK